MCVRQRALRRLCRVGGVVARATIPLFFPNSKISAVGDLGRETQGKGPLKRASGLRDQTYHVPRKYPLVAPKSEARSEISVKFGIYNVKDKNFHVRCLTPLYIRVGN